MSSQAGAAALRLGRKALQPLIGAGQWYNAAAKKNPFMCGVLTTGVKTSLADTFAQKVVEGRDHMDWNRHAIFCTFGFTYLGGFQYWLYNIKFTQMCGPLTSKFGHRAVAPIKVFLDQFIHHPLLYFPVFFSMKTVLQGKPLSAAVTKYRTDIRESCKALWAVWVPLQLVNFGFVPRHLRIPFAAGVSFAWCIILSVMQSKFDARADEQHHLDSNALERDDDDGGGEEMQQQQAVLAGATPPIKPVAGPTFASGGVVATAAVHSPARAAQDAAVRDA